MRRFLLLVVLVLGCAGPALADSDQDRARKAVQSGTVRPLGEILVVVRRSYPGRVLDAGIGETGGRWFYDLRLLGTAGQVTELRVDAGSAEVLGVRGGSRRPEPGSVERERPPPGGFPSIGFDREARGRDAGTGKGKDGGGQ